MKIDLEKLIKVECNVGKRDCKKHGDFSTSIAFVLAQIYKQLKKKVKP